MSALRKLGVRFVMVATSFLVLAGLAVQVFASGLTYDKDFISQACASFTAVHGDQIARQDQKAQVTSCGTLSRSLLGALKKNADFQMVQARENVDLSRAIVATIKDSDLQMVSVPVDDGRQDGIRVVWAYYDTKAAQFARVAIGDLRQAGDVKGHTFFRLYAPDQTLLYTAEFQDGKLTSSELSEQVGVQWEDWNCFARCIKRYYDSMPDWVKQVCSGLCVACFTRPNPGACWGCALCLGLGGAFCHGFCWR